MFLGQPGVLEARQRITRCGRGRRGRHEAQDASSHGVGRSGSGDRDRSPPLSSANCPPAR
jgi:hypothetical protein